MSTISNNGICGVMADMSTIAGFIGAGAKLSGFEEVSWACGHLKLPLIIPSLLQKGREKWGKEHFTSVMCFSGGILMSGKVFQKVSSVQLGALFNGVANAQLGMTIAFLGYSAGARAADPSEKHRVEQGAICAQYTLKIMGSGLEAAGFSPTLVTTIKLVDGSIGTGRIYWKLRDSGTS